MIVQRLVTATLSVTRSLLPCARLTQTLREKYRQHFSQDVKNARGLALLREWLSPGQRAQFDAGRYFDVIGCDSGTRYRIRFGVAANVHELDDNGCPTVGFCFVPLGRLVEGDVMLAQKIALETNETTVLAVANRFPAEVGRRSDSRPPN